MIQHSKLLLGLGFVVVFMIVIKMDIAFSRCSQNYTLKNEDEKLPSQKINDSIPSDSTTELRGSVSNEVNDGNDSSSSSSKEVKTVFIERKRGFELVPDKCTSKMTDAFDHIYTDNMHWSNVLLRQPGEFYGNASWPSLINPKSSSGAGSDLGKATEISLKIITDTIQKYDIKSMVDIPCGDLNWMMDSYLTDSLPFYLGMDIVKDVIDVNQKRFAHHNNKHFQFWDAAECEIPKFINHDDMSTNEKETAEVAKPFDLIHVRDVVQHLPLDKGVGLFCNVFKSGAKYLITTTYPSVTINENIDSGAWYKNNLKLSPFSFPDGESCEATHAKIEDDHTCVFDLKKPWVQDFISKKCSS